MMRFSLPPALALARVSLVPVTLLALATLTSAVPAQTAGMMVSTYREGPNSWDDFGVVIVVFDPTDDSVTTTLLLAEGISTDGLCAITPDRSLGVVVLTDHPDAGVFLVDLTTTPPSLQAETIPFSGTPESMVITPDGRFLVIGACDVISATNLSTRTETTFQVPFQFPDCGRLDVCGDGSILVAGVLTGNVHRLTIDETGTMADTGEVMFSGGTGVLQGPINIFCAPDAASGIVMRDRRGPQGEVADPPEIRSFTIPGLAPVDTRAITGNYVGVSGIINPGGDRVYVRSTNLQQGNPPPPVTGVLDAFAYTPATAELGAVPLFSVPVGVQRSIVVHPEGGKLYLTERTTSLAWIDPGQLGIYDAYTGTFLTQIALPNLEHPSGVCLAREDADNDGDGFNEIQGDCNDTESATHPGAVEVNDGLDNQCECGQGPEDCGFGAIDEISGQTSWTDTMFCWESQTGAASYEIVRSHGADFTQDCLIWTTATNCINDPSNPEGGNGYFYLVRALMPNVGSWGQQSNGDERTVPCVP